MKLSSPEGKVALEMAKIATMKPTEVKTILRLRVLQLKVNAAGKFIQAYHSEIPKNEETKTLVQSGLAKLSVLASNL